MSATKEGNQNLHTELSVHSYADSDFCVNVLDVYSLIYNFLQLQGLEKGGGGGEGKRKVGERIDSKKGTVKSKMKK